MGMSSDHILLILLFLMVVFNQLFIHVRQKSGILIVDSRRTALQVE